MKNNEPRFQKNPGQFGGPRNGSKWTRQRTAFRWDSIEAAHVGQFVSDVCDSGNGVVLGRTADGGALSITILRGEERIREWPASVEDFTKFAVWCGENLADSPSSTGGD